MDKGTTGLLNVVFSVLAPVMVLEHCSTQGEGWWEIGTAWAMVVALALPLLCGLATYIREKRLDPLTLVGLLGALLTGGVTLYASSGEGEALRPDTPWWYAAKEALIALILSGAVLANPRGEGSLLRSLVYSDTLFDIKAIEQRIIAQGKQTPYHAILLRASLGMAGSLLFSAVANFLLALYFLLPVLNMPAAEQAVEYNYAVGKMTWWGYIVIGLPLLASLVMVIRYLARSIGALTGMEESQLYLR